jgi:hypothetical protein
MSRQKFENDVLVPTLVADGFLQHTLAVGDQTQIRHHNTRHLPTSSLLIILMPHHGQQSITNGFTTATAHNNRRFTTINN